jgi:propanol-preferring alcohol dehydrogenase
MLVVTEMRAMVCDGPGSGLREETRPLPAPGPGEVLVKVLVCGVCRTDLHVVDGEVTARYPIVPGHEVVGRVVELGEGVASLALGDRIGVPWLGRACGLCAYCREGRENLCDAPEFTGATRDGGYATHALADARFCFPLPPELGDLEAAPLLCAGLIGWRAYRLAGPVQRLGLYGFGAAAHILAQLAAHDGREVYAFTRAGDAAGQDFARRLGCRWAGSSEEPAPEELDAAIIFAPVGALIPAALKTVRKGGRVVCAGIYMSDIPSFPYANLWGERQVLSVANLTREDGASFLTPDIAGRVTSHVERFALGEANEALRRLRAGEIEGAAVLVP